MIMATNEKDAGNKEWGTVTPHSVLRIAKAVARQKGKR